MDDDDTPRGHVLTRREALARIGAAAFAFAAGRASAAACIATPEQTEGPFFVDTRLERSDVRSDSAGGPTRVGTPLALDLTVSRIGAGGCAPLAGAIVDIWHCDADGVYSGTRGSERFLRGYQISDADGRVRFVTIYPGWYSGRAVHIHFKVRTNRGDRATEFTSQLYFDDRLTDRVHERPPYAGPASGRTRNGDDALFRAGGRSLIVDARQDGEGYAAAYDVGLRGA